MSTMITKAATVNRAVNAIPLNGPCVICGKPGRHRCSICKTQIYCDKTCQLIDWKKHMHEYLNLLAELENSLRDFNLYDQCKCGEGILFRVYGWDFLCQECFSRKAVRYIKVEHTQPTAKVSELMKHSKCQKNCKWCGSSSFIVLRDEMLDEWLVCVSCEKSKQLIRCWNDCEKRYINCIERPLLRYTDDGGIERGEENTDELNEDVQQENTEEATPAEVSAEADLDFSISRHAESTRVGRQRAQASEAAKIGDFKKYVEKSKPEYKFSWINQGDKDPLEVSFHELETASTETIKAALLRCGVKEALIINLEKNELMYAYACIAAGKKDIPLLTQLDIKPPVTTILKKVTPDELDQKSRHGST